MDKDPIDVAALIASVPAAEHARRADAYFAGLTETHWSFRKPFAPLSKVGPNLTRLGAMLEAADLSPGLRVLDFGCGVAWLGRMLAQNGCDVVAADVSPTALAAAEAHDRRFHRRLEGKLRYIRTDGARLDLPDASLDRILCHEALHHVPDQAATIAEFRRILAPGGRAVFMEPGPDHSRAEGSQSEMRAHGVIENDIRVEAIWEAASRAGFGGIEVGLFTVRPEMLPLDRFMDLWRHEMQRGPRPEPPPGPTYRSLALPVLGGFRMFVLHAEAPAATVADSTEAQGLAAEIAVAGVRRGAEGVEIELAITNTGRRAWRPSGSGRGAVNLGVLLLAADGSLANRNFRRHPCVPGLLPPGGRVTTRLVLPLPAGARLSLDMVAEHVAWFGQPGIGLEVPLPG